MGTEINLIPKQAFDASAIITGIIAHARLPVWVITKPADQIVTDSEILVDDNDFQWSLVNGERYHFKLVLSVSVTAASGFRFKFLPPGACNIYGYCQDVIGILTAGMTLPEEDYTVVKIFTSTTGLLSFIVVEGTIHCLSTGLYKFQWAQGTADASDTILQAGSIAILHRLGV